MRLLHIVPTYLPATRYGGPIYSVHGLCRALAERGHDVHVFTTNVDGPGDSDVTLGEPVELDGVKVWYFSSLTFRRFYYSADMNTKLAVMMSTFELVHLHTIFNWPIVAAAREARRFSVPYVYTPRGMLMKDAIRLRSVWVKRAWIRLFERENIRCATRMHVTSELEADELDLLGLTLPPLFNVPNGMDLSDSIPDSVQIQPTIKKALSRSPYILFLSRVNAKKGLDRLIKAMKYLPEVTLLICGPDENGYKQTIEQLAQQLAVSERVVFLGSVKGQDKSALFRGAELMVLPSYSENFGNVVPEAMAHGCPVVTTPEVGAAEILLRAEAGLVVDGAPDILGPAIRDLMADKSLLRTMAENGPGWIEKNLTWQSVGEQVEKVYLAMLDEVS